MLSLCISGFLGFLQSAIFLVGYISNNSLFPEPLNAEEEKRYIETLETGNEVAKEEARNVLIERNLRLVAHVCKKYNTTNIDQDDLISIGTIGLIKGINSFKSGKNTKLSTYVSKCVDNEILMYLRSTKKLNAEVSLEDPIGKDKDDNTVKLQDVLENNEKNIEEEVDLKLRVKRLYDKMKEILKDREKMIIELRFGLDGGKPKTQNQIAKMLRNFTFLCIATLLRLKWNLNLAYNHWQFYCFNNKLLQSNDINT